MIHCNCPQGKESCRWSLSSLNRCPTPTWSSILALRQRWYSISIQLNDEDVLHSIVFCSKIMILVENNYHIVRIMPRASHRGTSKRRNSKLKSKVGLQLVGGWKSWARAGNFFFWTAQLSAYANHEFKNWYYLVKIARRQLDKQQKRSIEAVHMHSLSETSRKQHNHRSCISWIVRRAKILLHMLSICTIHAKSWWTQLVTCSLTSYRLHFSCQIFLMSFLLHSHCSARDLHHHFSHRLQHWTSWVSF